MDQYRVYISSDALRHIKNTADYIATDLSNPLAANKFLDRILEKISQLDTLPNAYPLANRKCKRVRELRKLIVKSFIVYFVVDAEKLEVTILAVVYGKRDQFRQLQKLDL